MTKNWDSVRWKIKKLSVDEKKHLQEVKKIMETQHNFRASTRAYRMKLKEWGYLRFKPSETAKDRRRRRETQTPQEESEDSDYSDRTATASQETAALEQYAPELLPAVETRSQVVPVANETVLQMLDAVLEGDSETLEPLILANPDAINAPIGLPFDIPGRFFNHPAIQKCVILQHPAQTLLDIASALPNGPVPWVLLCHKAKGSTHPLGTDLAFQNAIKNGRTYTVMALLQTGHSKVNGNPGTTWQPLRQAVFWNVPDIVRVLLDRGATVNDITPTMGGRRFKSTLQLALDRRISDYRDKPARDRTEKILKMLLDAGADIHAPPAEDMSDISPFEMFIKPWQDNPFWATDVNPVTIDCFEAFLRKGAILETRFSAFACSHSTGNTLIHQVLWHSTPTIARLLVDHAVPSLGGNGSTLLHEIVGCCELAKRHPADTLRDIGVLLGRGADPNLVDTQGYTPLTACIARCPSIDIVPRLNTLLQGGADPELKDLNSMDPIVYVARTFEEPLLSQIMDTLLTKFRGRRKVDGQLKWDEGLFPIPKEPKFVQVLWYSGHSAEFEASMRRMLPPDVIPAFRKAAFSVASKNYLDIVTARAGASPGVELTITEKELLQYVLTLRKDRDLPEYEFSQSFVVALLTPVTQITKPLSPDMRVQDVSETGASINESMAPSPSARFLYNTPTVDPNLPTPLPLDTPQPETITNIRRGSSSSSSTSSSGSVASEFVPTTTHIRWPAIGRKTRPSDIEKARDAVLKYTCASCNNGLKLTAAELERHEEEHAHTMTCSDVDCRRRFCVVGGRPVMTD